MEKSKGSTRYSGFDIFNDFNSIFSDELFSNTFNVNTKTSVVDYKVIETKGDDIVFELPVVGNDPADVSIKAVEGNQIRVKAEQGESSFSKEINSLFQVPSTHKNSSAKAVISNGVLTISISKRKSAKEKEIEVEY